MKKSEQTAERLQAGITVPAEKRTTIQLLSPMMEILIGGPYKIGDEAHTYGHMALRVSTSKEERVYDFGRYGKTGGEYSATGDGILRVWENFNSYISGENAYGRITKGFMYEIPSDRAGAIFAYYDSLTANATERRAKHPKEREFKLPKDYHGVTNNCVTMSLSGARLALPLIDSNGSAYNQGRGMSELEKVAARGTNFGFWPSQIFMPADVQLMLEKEKRYAAKKIENYGGPAK